MRRIIIATLVLAAPVLARAADVVRPALGGGYTFNANTVLLDEAKQPARDSLRCKIPATKDVPGQDCELLTVGWALRHLLFFGGYKDQATVTAETMWARYELGNRIESNEHASLTAPEVTLIETLLPLFYPSPLIAGQVLPLIDPNAKPGPIK